MRSFHVGGSLGLGGKNAGVRRQGENAGVRLPPSAAVC